MSLTFTPQTGRLGESGGAVFITRPWLAKLQNDIKAHTPFWKLKSLFRCPTLIQLCLAEAN